MSDEPMLDLRPCKAAAARSLPIGHPFREGVLQEPDFLPLEIALAKLEAYARIAFLAQDQANRPEPEE